MLNASQAMAWDAGRVRGPADVSGPTFERGRARPNIRFREADEV